VQHTDESMQYGSSKLFERADIFWIVAIYGLLYETARGHGPQLEVCLGQ